jgi:hypothetical protein
MYIGVRKNIKVTENDERENIFDVISVSSSDSLDIQIPPQFTSIDFDIFGVVGGLF